MSIVYQKANQMDSTEMRFIAEQDSKIPLLYDPNYIWSEKSISGRLEYYNKLKEDDFFEVALHKNKVVGFHIVHEIPYPPDLKAGSIVSLWVSEEFRKQGIGSELKRRGEAWARVHKLVFLQTAVHIKNSGMLEINKNFGFELTYLNFRKKL